MDKQVLCHVDALGFNQKVQFPDGSEKYLPTENFAEMLVTACAQRNYKKVHLFGNTDFLKGIQAEIEFYHANKYTETTLEIEVN
jgi:hypothetical protein